MSETAQDLLAHSEAIDHPGAATAGQLAKRRDILRAALSDDGLAALLGARENIERELIEVEPEQLRAARLRIIGHFLANPSPAAPVRGRPALRQRMIKAERERQPVTPAAPRNLLEKLGARRVALLIVLAALVLCATLAVKLNGALGYLLMVATGGLYLTLMALLGTAIKKSLDGVLGAHTANRSGAGLFSTYIATSIVLGATAVLALLYFDYVTHAAAAAVADAEKLAAQAAARGAPVLHVNLLPSSATDDGEWSAGFGAFAGTFGDFFGGVLNPILTFGTVVGLTITILIQRSQLAEEKQRADDSAKVAKLQVFETTFFNLLNLHNAGIDDLRFTRGSVGMPAAGRSAFGAVLEEIHDLWVPDIGTYFKTLTPGDAYQLLQEQQNHVLGHYFRNLYQVLAFVDNHPASLAEGDWHSEHQARKRYTNILRAQLSSHELATLFYNCRRTTVDDGTFRELLVEYELLEHLPLEYDHGTHRLRIRGFDFAITRYVYEYLREGEGPAQPSGAFGKNPQIGAYLTMRTLLGLT